MSVVVGEESKSFTVHEQLLTHYSGFFSAALNGRFREAEEKRVILREEDPKIFEFFLHWLYYQRFPKEKLDGKALVQWWLEAKEPFVDLYVFSDKYSIKDLGKDAIDTLYHRIRLVGTKVFPSLDTANKAFECLGPKSPMCRFLVDAFCVYGGAGQLRDIEHGQAPLFISHLCCQYSVLFASGGRQEDCCIDLCDYHEHLQDEQSRAQCVKERKSEACKCPRNCEECYETFY